MKRRAPKVFRWVERMNAPDPDMPEYGERDASYLPDDAVPATLEPLFRQMGDELLPELTDKAAMLGRFVADTDPQEGAPVTNKPHQRIVETVQTSFRGVSFESGVQPYMLYLWQRVTDARDALAPEERRDVDDWLEGVGLAALLTAGRPIRVERVQHIEVWGRQLQTGT